MTKFAKELAVYLKHVKGRKVTSLNKANDPKGLPAKRTTNSKDENEGVYKQDGLADPGFQNYITGSGKGPLLGRGHGR